MGTLKSSSSTIAGKSRGRRRRATDKAPLTRTLDKKEVEDEVVEALGKLGHEADAALLDGSTKSLHGAGASSMCDLVFNLAESFAGNDTADYCIAAYLELLGKRFTGSGSHGLLYAQDKAVAKKILEFHGIHTPVFARSFRGRLDFSHDLEFPVIVKPAREDGSIGIEFNAVVNSIRELMERIDWLHANFDSPVLIEEYVEGREMYVGVHRQRQSDRAARRRARPVEAAGGHAADRRRRGEVGEGDRRPTATRSRRWPRTCPDETVGLLQQTAVAVFQALELRDYARIDMRLRPDGRVAVIEANPNPWLASKAEFAMAARKAGRTYSQLIGEIAGARAGAATAAPETARNRRSVGSVIRPQPLAADAVRLAGISRPSSAQCPVGDRRRRNVRKMPFLWAFSLLLRARFGYTSWTARRAHT